MPIQVKILAKIINTKGILTAYYLEDITGFRKPYSPQIVLQSNKTRSKSSMPNEQE